MKEEKDRVLDLCKDISYFSCPATATVINVASTMKESIDQIADNLVFDEYPSQPDVDPPKPKVAVSTTTSEDDYYSKSEVRKKVFRITKKVT